MSHPSTIPGRTVPRELAWGAGLATVALAWWLVRDRAGWIVMITVAAGEWVALKIATGAQHLSPMAWPRALAFFAAWPGMNAPAFFANRRVEAPLAGEWIAAAAKTALGLALVALAILHAHDPREMLVAWCAVLGFLFTLHFGAFHLVSCAWRRAGVDAPPLMRAPILAASLAELWGARWNLAFANAARRFALRPLARRWGAGPAGFAVFAVSGLVHESVVSLPARGGWGGPTLYFLVQGAGAAIERGAWGARLGLGRGVAGRAWTLLVAAAPVPLLFHAPFAREVIVPLCRALTAFLP